MGSSSRLRFDRVASARRSGHVSFFDPGGTSKAGGQACNSAIRKVREDAVMRRLLANFESYYHSE